MTDSAKTELLLVDKEGFVVKNFAALTTIELKQIFQLRQQVFIIEQNCPYPDIDEDDMTAWHLYHQGPQIIDGYARILIRDRGNCHIGRVVVAQDKRQQGLGQMIMKAAIDYCQKSAPQQCIVISAQSYLARFYRELGFCDTGEYYLEDDIPHMRMILPAKT